MDEVQDPSDAVRGRQVVRGRHLRYLLVLILDRAAGTMSLAELVRALHASGFSAPEPEHKAVSDSLRWALGHRHAVRLARGRYASGHVTKQTRHRYRRRTAALRAAHDARLGRPRPAGSGGGG